MLETLGVGFQHLITYVQALKVVSPPGLFMSSVMTRDIVLLMGKERTPIAGNR